MDRDEIIRMAREAHLDVYGLGKDHEKFVSVVERFATLVYAEAHKDGLDDFETVVLPAAIKAEREACAQIAFNAKTYLEAAHEIRERGAP